MKKLIRRFILWAFKDKFRVYGVVKHISDIDMVRDRLSYEGFIKREIAEEIARKLLEDGVIDISCEPTFEKSGKMYKAKLYIFNPPSPQQGYKRQAKN